jgi:endopeptidase La
MIILYSIFYNMNEEIEKYKRYSLQKTYQNITKIITDLEKHLKILIDNNLLSSKTSWRINEELYNVIKNLNTEYNNEINSEYVDNEKILLELNNNNNYNFLDILDEYNKTFENIYFQNIKDQIKKIINEIGNIDLIKTISFYAKLNFDKSVTNFINEINDLIIPLKCNIFESVINELYFWRIPDNNSEFNLLKKERELWIRIPNTNKFFKIVCIFKIDYLSNRIKTCQINNSILFERKKIILDKLDENNINLKFIKVFIRHDYLGNIYCMDVDEYYNYLIDFNKKAQKYYSMNFIQIMKLFVDNSDNVYEMFNIIFILLLGDDDKIDIAGLLLGLTKEKKGSKNDFYDLLYNNLTYFLQTKIKKSNSNIKHNLDKIKSMSVEDIDYKKQLIINKHIPEKIKTLVLEKIEEMKSFNSEYYKQQTYVKTILNYPWHSDNNEYKQLNDSPNNINEYLGNIENKLNESCYGHEDAKKLLLQIIGKWISNPDSMGTSFGMVGPPGVGKTLLAKSIGKALNIPFAQITLGGQNDGELLHGHGYTYSGSQPGLIVKKMCEMGSPRCILYFDELDKACSKHGSINEITSILIHLTDPNMNKHFQDRFFQGVDFPLDKVIMIFSYNDSSLVDPILLDRLKEIRVEPYTLIDKVKICQNFVIPELIENIGISKDIVVNKSILEYIINNYTGEAGIRGIKSKLEDLLMNLNLDNMYYNKYTNKKKIILNKKLVHTILNPPSIQEKNIHSEPKVGVINGLYATNIGTGGITPIQIFKNIEQSCKQYEIKLTGKQGDVMKESVLCSLTAGINYLKSNYKKYNINDFNLYCKENIKHGFHVHAPAGSTPKDGPSAGCAFTSAFISCILNKPIRNDIAMTGEIDLIGNITKIGGLEFKLQGAKKAGVKIVYVSEENSEDIDKIKRKYKNLFNIDFKVIIVKNISDLIDNILI